MRFWRLLLVCIPMVIVGCKPPTRPSETPARETPTKAMPGRFEPIAGRGPDVITELRAVPATSPEFIESQSSTKDEQALSSKGYVKVADGY